MPPTRFSSHLSERRASGAFYTPQPLVAHIADEALVTALRRPPLREDIIARSATALAPPRMPVYPEARPACHARPRSIDPFVTLRHVTETIVEGWGRAPC